MTRKDYREFARMMACTKPSETYPLKPITVWTDIMRELISVLARDNPRFDREKFISAANGR